MHPIRYVATRLFADPRGFMRPSAYQQDSCWYATMDEARKAHSRQRKNNPHVSLHFQITDTYTGDVYTDLQGSKELEPMP